MLRGTSKIWYVPDFGLSFDGAGEDAFDDVFLADQVEDDDGDDGQDQAAHHRAHVHRAVPALQVLDGDAHGLEPAHVQGQIGRLEKSKGSLVNRCQTTGHSYDSKVTTLSGT